MFFRRGKGNQGNQGNQAPKDPNQGQRKSRWRGRRSQGRQQGQVQGPASPPNFFQRDVLLMPSPESLSKIQAVRSQFDPLALKVPPHITLLEPRPRAIIQNDYLKKLNLDALPKIDELRFEKVMVHRNVFLWMVPASESAERLKAWREALTKGLPPVEEEFIPHVTLGYVSRDRSAEEVLKIAGEKLEIPGAFFFIKLLLEEFGDNQVSASIDSRTLNR